jgi:hypothetical protein
MCLRNALTYWRIASDVLLRRNLRCKGSDRKRDRQRKKILIDIKVTDDGWIPAYAASVHELVHKHGGKYLSRSGNVKTLEGKPLDTTFIALLEFPS